MVGELNSNLKYLEGISRLQNNGLGKVIIDYCKFLQIRASVVSNVWRDVFLNGTMKNDEINRNFLGIGGACVLITFDECSSSTSVDLKDIGRDALLGMGTVSNET